MTAQERAAKRANLRKLVRHITGAVVDELRTQPVVTQRLFTVRQAGVYLGRTERAVYSLLQDGKLPKVQLDRRTFIDREDLERLILEGKN